MKGNKIRKSVLSVQNFYQTKISLKNEDKDFLREINHKESYITGDGENSSGTRHTRWKSGPIRQTKCMRKINKKVFSSLLLLARRPLACYFVLALRSSTTFIE